MRHQNLKEFDGCGWFENSRILLVFADVSKLSLIQTNKRQTCP
jgi:hypothetical protein